MVSVQARLEQASYAVGRGLSQRRACALLWVSRSMLYYQATLPQKDTPVINAMKTISGRYPRFGYRRVQILLQREGMILGKHRCARLWAEAGLQVPKKPEVWLYSKLRMPHLPCPGRRELVHALQHHNVKR